MIKNEDIFQRQRAFLKVLVLISLYILKISFSSNLLKFLFNFDNRPQSRALSIVKVGVHGL